MSELKPHRIWIFLTCLTHLLVAYFSFGYHHPDEHYQILEYANVWLGYSDSSHLTWEFHTQIRPWLQPILSASFFQFISMFGIQESVAQALALRILMSVLNVWALIFLFRSVKFSMNGGRLYWIFTAFLWFFPYIHARTSSENASAIAITFAFGFLFRNKLFLCSLLFSLAFQFRYQVALGIFPLYLWLLIKSKPGTLRFLFTNLFAIAIPTAIGLVADRFGYQTWVFTPWNYYYKNLVEGIAATYNPYPFWQYFVWFLELHPFFSIPIFAGFAVCFKIKELRSLFLFSFGFFIFHCFISNKEYRFLFPLLNFSPLVLVYLLEYFHFDFTKTKKLTLGIALLSLPAMLISGFRPANLDLWWHLAAYRDAQSPSTIWYSNIDFLPKDQSMQKFYRSENLQIRKFNTAEELSAILNSKNGTALSSKVALDFKGDQSQIQEFFAVIAGHNCELIQSSLPAWVQDRMVSFSFAKRSRIQRLYECH